MTRRTRTAPAIAALLAATLLTGCATVPGQDRLAEKDPLEKFNRGVWGVNQAADKVVIRPAASVYRAVLPRDGRRGISNFFANLTEPWSLINNLLQGKPDRAGRNLKRFVVNTTLGLGGLFDPAGKSGVQPAPEDFGQTMAKWGFNGGPYLVLPLLGPSTMRDGIGTAAAWGADPINIGIRELDPPTYESLPYRALQVIDIRSQLIDSGADAFLKSSLDPYAAARSAYLQRRRAQIMDQEDSLDAGPPDEDVPAAETVPKPVGEPATAPGATNPTTPPPAEPQPAPNPPPEPKQ